MAGYLDDILPLLSEGVGKSLLSKSSRQRKRGRNIGLGLFIKTMFDEKLSKNALQDVEDMERNLTAQKAENALKFKKRSRIGVRYQNLLAEAQEKGIGLLEHMKNRAGDSWIEEATRSGTTPDAINSRENIKLRNNYIEDVGTANYNELMQEYDNFEEGPQTLAAFNLPLTNFIAGQKRKLLSPGNTDMFGKVFSKIKGEEYNFDLAQHNANVDKITAHKKYPNSKITRLDKELPTAYGEIELINRDSIYNWLQTNKIMTDIHDGNLSFPAINNEINKLIEKEGASAVTLDRVQRLFLDFGFDTPDYNSLIKAGNDLEEGQKLAFRKFEAEGGDLSWLANEPSLSNPLLQVLITKGPTYSKEIEQIKQLDLIPNDSRLIQIERIMAGTPEGNQLLEAIEDDPRLKPNYLYKIDEISKKLGLDPTIKEVQAVSIASKFLLSRYQNPQNSGNFLESEMIGYDIDVLRTFAGSEIDDDDFEKLFPTYMDQARNIKDPTSRDFKAQQIYDTFVKRLEDQKGDYDLKVGKLNEMNKITARLVKDQHIWSDFDENFKLINREVKEAMKKPEGTDIEISENGWDIEALNDIPYLGGMTEFLYGGKINPREIGVTVIGAGGTYHLLKMGLPYVAEKVTGKVTQAIDKANKSKIKTTIISKIGKFAIKEGLVDPRVEVTKTVDKVQKVDGKPEYKRFTKDVEHKSGPKRGQVQWKAGQRERYLSGPNKGKLKPPIIKKEKVIKPSRKGTTNFTAGQKYLKENENKLWNNPILGKSLPGRLFRVAILGSIFASQKGEAAEDLTIGDRDGEMYKEEMESLGIGVYDPLEDTEREI